MQPVRRRPRPDRRGMRAPALLALLLAAAAASTCRAAARCPEGMRKVYVIDGRRRSRPFAVELRRGHRASPAASVTAHGGGGGHGRRVIQRDRSGRRVLSVSARNTPQEYEIFYAVEYSVDRGGKEVLELQPLELIRNLQLRRDAAARQGPRGGHHPRGDGTRSRRAGDAPARVALTRRSTAGSPREAIGRRHELVRVAGLERRMSGVRHDAEVGFRPRLVQVPGAAHRADDVVAALHDHRRDVPDPAHAAQQLVLAARRTPG